MKLRLLILTIILGLLPNIGKVLADNLSSPNYVLIDPELSSTSGTSTTANYKLLTQGSNGISHGSISSSLYRIGSGQGYTFMANVPKVTCFETTTDSGSTDCVSLPRGNGMIGECGETGCYDRAVIQIDTQSNPTDTVYSLQLSKDNWATIYIVDGTSHTLKPLASKTIADYKTKSAWEGSPWDHFNIVGLEPNTEYKARVTALQGDFSESAPGPSVTATTSMPAITFDLDISPDLSTNTNAPYVVNLGVLTPETAKFQSSQRIKIDTSTNAQSGISVYVQDLYGGIRSTSTSYTLTSSSEDLSNPASGEGFGLQESGVEQSASSAGYIVPSSTYDVAGSNVGEVSSAVATRTFCSLVSSSGTCGVDTATWVTGGKALFTIGARATLAAPAKSDYTDTLTFTVTGGW